MESKNNKEIVQHIVDKIKSTQELPYREGAWEDFQRQHAFNPKRKSSAYYWVASAAALLIAGVFAMKYWPDNNIQGTNSTLANNHVEVYEQPTSKNSQNNDTAITLSEKTKDTEDNILANNRIYKSIEKLNVSNGPDESNILNIGIAHGTNQILSNASIEIPADLHHSSFVQQSLTISANNDKGVVSNSNRNDHMLGYQSDNQDLTKNTQLKLDQRRFKFKDRFDLGLFVSPSSTNENFNFGGGLLLSYNINKNLSVRTGLAFNKYEVGSMRDPISNAETQVFASNESIQKNSNGLLAQASTNNALLIPNINAVTGNVQAFEIPVDLKMKFSKGLYVSSGIAYAVILDQNRYAHYIENANTKIFKNGLPENKSQMESAVMPITKSIKTEEQNIRTNGFGGFVNLSLGKEVKLKQSFSISVEPFVKLPVGNFKQTDMNYTNGGLRIITNF